MDFFKAVLNVFRKSTPPKPPVVTSTFDFTDFSDVMAGQFKTTAIHFIQNTPLLNVEGKITEGWAHWLSIGLPDFNETEINETLADLKEEHLEAINTLVQLTAKELNDPKNKAIVDAIDTHSLLASLEHRFQPKVKRLEHGDVYIKRLGCWYLLPNSHH